MGSFRHRVSSVVFVLFLISFASAKIAFLKFTPKIHINFCFHFDTLGHCQSCLPGYLSFPFDEHLGYYCVCLINGCIKYSFSGECLQCGENRTLEPEYAWPFMCRCADGYISFDEGKTCLSHTKTLPHCKELESPRSCKTCVDGYYGRPTKLNSGEIVNVCNDCSKVFGKTCPSNKCFFSNSKVVCVQ